MSRITRLDVHRGIVVTVAMLLLIVGVQRMNPSTTPVANGQPEGIEIVEVGDALSRLPTVRFTGFIVAHTSYQSYFTVVFEYVESEYHMTTEWVYLTRQVFVPIYRGTDPVLVRIPGHGSRLFRIIGMARPTALEVGDIMIEWVSGGD